MYGYEAGGLSFQRGSQDDLHAFVGERGRDARTFGNRSRDASDERGARSRIVVGEDGLEEAGPLQDLDQVRDPFVAPALHVPRDFHVFEVVVLALDHPEIGSAEEFDQVALELLQLFRRVQRDFLVVEHDRDGLAVEREPVAEAAAGVIDAERLDHDVLRLAFPGRRNHDHRAALDGQVVHPRREHRRRNRERVAVEHVLVELVDVFLRARDLERELTAREQGGEELQAAPVIDVLVREQHVQRHFFTLRQLAEQPVAEVRRARAAVDQEDLVADRHLDAARVAADALDDARFRDRPRTANAPELDFEPLARIAERAQHRPRDRIGTGHDTLLWLQCLCEIARAVNHGFSIRV